MQIKIDRNNVEDIMPLTAMQEGMLFHYILNPDSSEYHEQVSVELTGSIDLRIMQSAWDFVIEKNEMLRTVFRWKDINKPVQVVLKKHSITVHWHDCSKSSAKEKSVEEIKQNDLQRRIDLETETLRVAICKLTERKYTMIVSNHHILYDGWSNALIMNELLEAYNALYKGLEPNTAYKMKFKEHIEWAQAQDEAKQKVYWENYLFDFEKNDDLFSKVELKGNKNHKHSVSKDITEGIKESAKQKGLSVAALLFGAWGILVQRLNNSNDILFGTTVSGRNHHIRGIENTVGLFINTIPLRVQTHEGEMVLQFVKKIDAAIKERGEFEGTPLVNIKEYAGVKDDSQLFNSIVVIENYPVNYDRDKNEMFAISDFSAVGKTNYNLALGISIDETIELDFQFNCFADASMITRICGYFEKILLAMISDESIKVQAIDILSEEERHKLLHEFNDTYAEYPRDRTIHQLFEEQVGRTPNNVALVFGEKSMTYNELNAKSNQLARVLYAQGVKPGSIVGIMVERSFEMIIGILGILKSGGAYLPIDSEYPAERIKFMLDDSEVNVLLTQSKLNSIVEFTGSKINLDNAEIYTDDMTNIESATTSKDLAYVVYTSGSTGMPKGVMVEHRNVVNLSIGQGRIYGIDKHHNVMQFSSISFDGSVGQIFTTLIHGAVLHLIDRYKLLDGSEFNRFLRTNAITHLEAVPSFLNEVDLDGVTALRNIVTGGDVCPRSLVEKLSEKTTLYNGYGPAEATCQSTLYCVNTENIESNIPIGKPSPNYKVYILNAAQNLVPLGAAGELYISGDSVARGYLNRPELTDEKFTENPFVSGERMYQTGDLVRWRTDGNIEFLGRIGNQVKIRGFRVELGEIESHLHELGFIKEVVVVAHTGDDGDRSLCAYFVSEEDISANDLRQHLSKKLPDYMIPSYYVRLERMPLSPNGKLDRAALPKPESKIETEYTAPRNETEEKLVQIWSEVLNHKNIGVYDNFFELGGHSLKGTVLVLRIQKELKVEFPLKELFRTPTIAGMSEHIAGAKPSAYEMISASEEKEYYESSSAQKRMYVLQQLSPKAVNYNISASLAIDGNMSREKFEQTINKLLARHEVLRTSFETIDNQVVQRIHDEISIDIEYSDKTEEYARDAKKCIDQTAREFIRSFDLSNAPLLRIGFVKLAAEKSLLLIDTHHIISDGVSLSVLVKEFTDLYEGRALNPQRIQYKDFSEWQNAYLKSEAMERHKEYWMEQFAGEISALNMPTDYTRPSTRDQSGDSVTFNLSKETGKKLKVLSRETGATLYMVLLSAVNILLSKYSGQEDIVVGSPIAGRPHADVETLQGMFVNMLAMRSYPSNGKSYIEFLREVKEAALEAYEHQGYQFEEMVDSLELRRDISRNPLFDVMFTLQNMEDTKFELEGLTLTECAASDTASKFDMEIMASESGEEVSISIVYSTSLFKRETIERFAEHMRNLLEEITRDWDIPLGAIDILSEEERHKLLYEFNDTYAEYPRDKTIHQMFEEQVVRTPENIALVFGEKKMSYGELNARANQVARVLREKGVKADTIVGLMVDRSFEMIIGILSILKAGGAYLPIDPDYPDDRIALMLNDSGSKTLLTQSWLCDKIRFGGKVFELDDDALYEGDNTNIEHINQTKDLAYVIYTSGSTGKPKGVMIEHGSVVNLCFGQIHRFKIDEHDRVLQAVAITFDASVEQIFISLLSGAALYLPNQDVLLDSLKFNMYVQKNAITFLSAVPSLLEKLNFNKLGDLRCVVSGGEAYSVDLLKSASKEIGEKTTFYNEYGLTEATVTSSMCAVELEEMKYSVPIGKPINNCKAYIIEPIGNNLSPIGVPGELYISGDGLARGYLNHPELTAEKFIENPFVLGERVYRTGDLARWLPDGEIDFIGRLDEQVKIRGFRVELGEIESRLSEIEEVKEAVVVAAGKEKNDDKYLCAYVVTDEEITAKEFRDRLSKSLPNYMIPSYFVRLSRLPLTSSGKIDRRALPNLEDKLHNEYVAPRNTIEETLTQIWSEVLGCEKIGIHDNFFELGGDSLKAMSLMSKINETLDTNIPIKDLFKALTIEGLSANIMCSDLHVESEK